MQVPKGGEEGRRHTDSVDLEHGARGSSDYFRRFLLTTPGSRPPVSHVIGSGDHRRQRFFESGHGRR